MKKLKSATARKLTSLMVAVTLAATMPLNTALAAPLAGANDQVSLSSISIDDKDIETVLKAIETYNKSGKRQDLDAVNALIRKLTPQQIIRLYAFLSKDFYLKNYLTKGFTFFDADKYLEKYPDVKKNALLQGITDLKQFALFHYLTFGMFEGRSSATSFDPVRAILHSPQILTHYVQIKEEKSSDIDLFEDEEYLEDGDLTKYVREEYVKETEKTTTEDLDEKGKVKPTPQPAPVTENPPAPTGGSSQTNSGTEEVPDNGFDTYREPVFRINGSGIIAPYTLYDPELKNTSMKFTIDNNGNYMEGRHDVTVNFNGDNVALAQKIASGKAFTLLQYMCGTDLESGSRAVTNEISTMLQASSDNLNIVIFIGGTKNYGSPYFNNSLSGARAGIYFLNASALAPEVKEKLLTIDFIEKTQQVTDILEGKIADTENLCKGLKYDDIINENTLIQLASISEIDMADPSLLTGFINFGTELFPADNYGLTLNNHGSGFENGIITTEPLEKDGQTVIKSGSIGPENLESALASTNLFRDKSVNEDGRLSFIFYDACLMGSVEQAYTLKDYSRYMIGSEEIGLGTTDYHLIVDNLNNTLEKNGNDRAISISVSQATSNQAGHGGVMDGLIGSNAVFSLDAVDDTFTKITALCKDFSYVLGENGCSSTFQNDVFKAIRKAAISSYRDGNTSNDGTDFRSMLKYDHIIDMGDYYNYLNINMQGVNDKAGQYSDADKEALAKINTELDAVLNSGFLVSLSVKTFRGFGSVTKTDYEGIIPLNYTMDTNKTYWTDIRNTEDTPDVYPYGVSMVFALGLPSSSYKTQFLFNSVKGKGMEDYCQFVADFLKFNEDPEGYDKQKKALAEELSSGNFYSKLITQQDGSNGYTNTLTDENGQKYTYISFKVADSYEDAGLTQPENSTGSPILDIIDTQPNITLTAVHKEYFDYVDSEDGNGRLEVDMICSEQTIKNYNINAGTGIIYFDASADNTSIITGYSLYGRPYDMLTEEIGKEDWQFILLSSLEKDRDEKKKALSLFSSDESYTTSTLSFNGSVLNEDNTSQRDAYHFFNNVDGNYTYLGSVVKTDNEYINVSNGIAISAYHYVLREEMNGDDIVRTYKEVLEGHDGFTDGYYSLKDKTQIGIRNINVTEYDPLTYSYSSLSTAYALDVGGTGEDYTQLAYVSTPKKYEEGDNAGNGQLGEIDMDCADPGFINSIGVKVTDASLNNGDTENPAIHIEEQKPFIKEGDTEVLAEAAPEPTTEVLTEAASEEATEVLTETASEEATEALTEAAPEEATEALTEAAPETATEVLTEAAPETAAEVFTETAPEEATENLEAAETPAEELPAEESAPVTEEIPNESNN